MKLPLKVIILLAFTVLLIIFYYAFNSFINKKDRKVIAGSDIKILSSSEDWEAATRSGIDLISEQGSVRIDFASHVVEYTSTNYDGTTFIGDLGAVYTITDLQGFDISAGWVASSSENGIDWEPLAALGPGTGCVNFTLVGEGDHYGLPSFDARYIKVETDGAGWCAGHNPIDAIEAANTSGTITTGSSQISGGENFWSWDGFLASDSEPANTSISYQFRSSTDGVNWTEWVDDISSVTSRTGDDSDNPTLYSYLQIKAILNSTDGVTTPSISQYNIDYHTEVKPGAPTAQTAVVQ